MRNFSFIVLIIVLFASCGGNKQTELVLKEAERLMHNKPDSALLLLKGISNKNISGAEQNAHYALLLSQAFDKNYVDITDDSLIRVAYNYYSHHNNAEKQARASYYLSQVQYNTSNYGLATVSVLEAIEHAQQYGDNRLLGLAYNLLGDIYEQQFLFEKAASNYEKSYSYYTKLELPRHQLQALRNSGRMFSMAQNYSKAMDYYTRALDLAKEMKDTTNILDVERLVASVFFNKGDMEQARAHLYYAYHKYNHGTVVNAQSHNIMLAHIYVQRNELDSARYYLKRERERDPIGKGRRSIEYELYNIEQRAGNLRAALLHLHNHAASYDSLFINGQHTMVLEVEQKYNNTKLEYANYKYKTRQQFIFIGIAAFVILAALLALYLYGRHKQAVAKRDNQIKDYLYVIKENESSMKQLTSNLNVKREKERRLRDLLERRFDLLRGYYDATYTYQSQPEVMNKKMRELLQMNSIEGEVFADLRDIVNEKYFGFVHNIAKAHPELNDNDINLLCLIRADFKTHQMCAVYNTANLQTIYTKKYRLSKKLMLKEGDTLETYIDRFSGDLTLHSLL